MSQGLQIGGTSALLRRVQEFSGRLLSADEHPAVIEGKWDRDKVVLMSFPDEAAFRAERIFRLSGNRLAA